MTPELPVKRNSPRLVSAVVRKDRRRNTPFARRRRLNQLIRELAVDSGFDLDAMTLSERGCVHQCATLLLQLELAQDHLVGGVTIDPDTCIRLTSEARRLLVGLRKRAGKPDASPPRGPLLSRITAPVTPETEPPA
jgi:hypothetical protein